MEPASKPPIRIAGESEKSLPRKINFTVDALKQVACPAEKDRVYVYDAKTPRLAFCRTEKGAGAFYVVKKIGGRTARVRLGGFPEISIEQARKLALKTTAQIAEGHDPQAAKRAARQTWALETLFQHYMDTYAKVHDKPRTWGEYKKQFDRYLDEWRSRKINTITSEAVRALHVKIGKEHGHYAANRVLSLLSAMFTYGKLENPTAGIPRFAEKKRDRFLLPDELPRFFAALDAEPNETIRDFIYMALWTGARRSNVQAMRWDQLNLDQGIWRIPETKNNDPQLVHLPAPAIEILTRRQKAQQEAEALEVQEGKRKADEPPYPWVFPARHGKSGHLTEPKAAWAAILKRAKIKDLRIHDLRRTMGSWQAATGASLPVIGKSLGHKTATATQIYARLQLDPVRQSVNAATEAILKAVEAAKKPKKEKK